MLTSKMETSKRLLYTIDTINFTIKRTTKYKKVYLL